MKLVGWSAGSAIRITEDFDTGMTCHAALQGRCAQRRLPRMLPSELWREIAVGLGIAIIGLLLALCASRAGAARPATEQHVPGSAMSLHDAAAATPAGSFLAPGP